LSQKTIAELFYKAATTDDPEGQFQYAMCLKEGRGVERDVAKATEWLKAAAMSGHAEAEKELEQIKFQQLSPSVPSNSPDNPSSEGPPPALGCALIIVLTVCVFLFPGFLSFVFSLFMTVAKYLH
jgi:hypothetical protein